MIFTAAVFIVWAIGNRIRQVESFLGHLEWRLILLQQAEFSRRLLIEQEHWREEYGEEPPNSLIDDVRTGFDVAPPYKQCLAEFNAILRKKHS